MLTLRADPWDPGYGMGFDAAEPDEEATVADPLVESGDWSAPLPCGAPAGPAGSLFFVDGVLRVEQRLLADEDGRRAPGLFGSYAAGSVHVNGTARYGEHEVGRALVLGGGFGPSAITLRFGHGSLEFKPVSEPGTDPNAPRLRLQQVMRDAETRLAASLAETDDALVLCDGPLTFIDPRGAPVVGIVKRFAKHYLDPDSARLLGILQPGERTPLFGIAIEGQPVHRYSWYCRLVPVREPWHDHAGLVRCEIGPAMGLDAARALADRVTALLPRFAGRPSDPRAPQNLAPIGALESKLRHQMGDHAKINRALTRMLALGPGTQGAN